MAFGFKRLPGTAANYVNIDNPDFASGLVLSKRQFRNYKELRGLAAKKPAAGDLRQRIVQTQARLRETQKELDRLERETRREFTASGKMEKRAAQRTIREQLRANEAQKAELDKLNRSGAGARRYHAALTSYVLEQQARGNPISRKEAAKAPEFREAVRLLKGKPNPRGSERIANENRENRRRALRVLGSRHNFQDVYDLRYGMRPTRVHRSGAASRRAFR